ncbi:Short-chain dehydrogenase [Haloechinothrix alba]|uniref:Short-chain dehydrogenase n=1 Tax=Haloechinothrix alba TaxID=664784 RepID=A0A238VMT6_9PSEU|nr:SDR family oxidoreductase [Haloechinothrix alba]SNR35457.1 Short-chain dehydrogenase [Haloechinothrix alba]
MSPIAGAGAVVTGGGGGIGKALAERLAAGGARVVVNDIDAVAAGSVAQQIGGYAVAGDAAGDSGVQELIAEARLRLGDIDVYCANAGVAEEGGPDAPEEAWARSWEVNVMAHVRATRHLLPRWLERGSGRFVSTASAAGLLTMLGSAPYSASKHAAVAFAEWLSATYGHRGVTVQCICPQGVRTGMLPEEGTPGHAVLGGSAIEPERVAECLWDALHDDRFLVLPHAEVADYYAKRAADTDRWLSGMRRMQGHIESM